jgi:hypothetical protein
MQYLVSVIGDTPGRTTPEEQAAIEVFDDRLQAEGYWVFAGGLESPSSATVIDNRGGEAMITDGPILESKEYLAGFWIPGGSRPRRGAQARRRGVEGLQRQGRGAAVPVSMTGVREAITRAHHEKWARMAMPTRCPTSGPQSSACWRRPACLRT